jgi:transposase
MSSEELYTLALNLNKNWRVSSVKLIEKLEQVEVNISYQQSTAIDSETSESCAIHDYVDEQSWQHINTFQYQTLIFSKIPRVKNSLGNINVISIPWRT